MEDGLETKVSSFLVDQLLSYPQKSRKKQNKQNKAESTVNSCILILDGQKVVNISPELEIIIPRIQMACIDFKVQVDAN